MGVSKVGGIFVHNQDRTFFLEKSTSVIREDVMLEARSIDQEVAEQALVAELTQLAQEELREMVATLAQADPASLFGRTEFLIRDLGLKIAAKAYQQRLDQKKTATKAPV